MDDTQADPYRMLRLVVRHGHVGVKLLCAALLAGGLLTALLTGWLWAVPITLAGTGLVYVLGRSLVELVHVIVEMLVPK